MDSYSVLATLTTIDSVADGSSYSNNLRDALSPFCNAPNGTANSDQLTSTIYQISEVSSIRSPQIVSVVSVVGSIVAIFIINTLKRKMILTLTLSLPLLYSHSLEQHFYTSSRRGNHILTIAFISITQFIYNVGPTLSFYSHSRDIPINPLWNVSWSR